MPEPGRDAVKLDQALICGDIDIRIGADGTWFHEGGPIGRKPLVKLFASVLRRDESGDYWLVTPAERVRIQVDDAPFVAVEVNVEGSGCYQRLIFRTNLDSEITANAEHRLEFRPRPGGEYAPYIALGSRLEALVLRSVYYELVTLGVSEYEGGEEHFGVWSAGNFFSFGTPSAAGN